MGKDYDDCYPNFQALVIATILAETSEESSLTEEQKTEFKNCWALINGDGQNKRVRRRLQLENQCIINDIKEYVSVWFPLIIMNFVNKMFWDVITNLGIFWQKVNWGCFYIFLYQIRNESF